MYTHIHVYTYTCIHIYTERERERERERLNRDRIKNRADARSLPPEAEAEPAPRAPSPCEERRKAEGHLGPGAYGNYSEKLVKKTLIVPKFSTLKRFHEPERPLTPPEQFMADPKPKRLLTPPQSPPRRPLEREEPWRPIRPLRPARLKLGRSSSSPTVLAGDSAHAETGGAQLLTQRPGTFLDESMQPVDYHPYSCSHSLFGGFSND